MDRWAHREQATESSVHLPFRGTTAVLLRLRELLCCCFSYNLPSNLSAHPTVAAILSVVVLFLTIAIAGYSSLSRGVMAMLCFIFATIHSAVFACLPAPRPLGSARDLLQVHPLGLILIAIMHVSTIQPLPPPDGFAIEPVMVCLVAFLLQTFFALQRYPLSMRLFFMAVVTSMSACAPLFSIGLVNELVLILGGNIIGLICGLVINSDQRIVDRLLDDISLHRHADSRLNHVLKGQLDGARALLQPLLDEVEAHNGPMPAACSITSDVRRMLGEAVDWCADAALSHTSAPMPWQWATKRALSSR
eukprot:scaffold79342_cov29-Tisochrysis_lutea.AAC.1